MNRCRILVVDSEQVWRGGQQQILSLIEGLARRRFEILVACPAQSQLEMRARHLGVSVAAFEQRSEFSPLAFCRCLSLLHRWKPQIVHFNTPKPILVGCLAARVMRPRPRCVASRRVIFPLASPLSRFKYSHLLDLTLTVSKSIEELLRSAGVPVSKLLTVNEGVRAPKERAPRGMRSRLVIGCVAHLSHEKGQETLIRATAVLRSQFPQLRVVLVGEGAERERLQALTRQLDLEDLVEFWGFREDADSVTYQFDIFCLVSESEGLSSAILAAMAAGLPIVASRVGGNPELVESGVNGFLVPAGDAEALAAALRQLLESRELREEMGRAGLQRVRESFTLERKIDETLQSYAELLANSPLR